MNIALVYRGFYKRKKGFYKRDTGTRKRNNFNMDILKNHLESINSIDVKNIHIYIHTYSVNDDEDKKFLTLFENYNLKKYIIEKNINNKISYSIIKSLELIDSSYDYDFIINLRFDLYFKKFFNEWRINYEKINICFKDIKRSWDKLNKVSDLMFMLPMKYNDKLIFALSRSMSYGPRGPGHFIYKHLLMDKRNIHFIFDGFFSSDVNENANDYFYIKRD